MESVVSDASDKALDESFAHGNYHRVAASLRADRWQTFASLGLCGNIAPALEGLERFDNAEARFYEGVVHWIDGDEDAAARRLEASDGQHAARLLNLIRKRRIRILSQLPWSQFGDGPHTVLSAGRSSAKFEVRNMGFSPGDLQNTANANIHAYYDPNNPPDFYLAQMIEWQLIPPNLQELPCPIIGHTADFDLHIHVVQPWLKLFDTLIVTDMTEYDDVSRLSSAPVATFPKTFCLSRSLPPPPPPGANTRDIDVLLTGTTFHEYHREKAEILHQILRVPGVEPFIVNGYLEWWQYHRMLSRSKLSISHIRHPGATPSRGVETLAMGTVLLAQPETTLRLWVGENEGLITYDLSDNGLSQTIARTLADFPKHEAAARRGMAIIREEFEPDRLGMQYLRFATFLAARPANARQPAVAPPQKRLVAWQGWLQKSDEPYVKLHERALNALQTTPPEAQTVESLSDPTRESMLDFVMQNLEKPSSRHAELLTASHEMYRLALQIRPQSLALRFNFIRAALHFGSPSDIKQALGVVQETLAAAPEMLMLEPQDDVMTWDYCAAHFNYRSYFDLVTESFMDGADRTAQLKALILASIDHYCGRFTGNTANFASAVERDPDFPGYKLAYAKALIRENDGASALKAREILAPLCAHSLHAVEAWSLLKALKQERELEIPDEPATKAAIQALETRTLLDSDYEAIRNGPYFRAQRLLKARDNGFDSIKKSDRPVALSILLADTNGSRYPRLISSLQNQSLPRENYEIVLVDVFDRISPAAATHADTVIALGQNEYLYNRNVAFNLALAKAQGAIVIIFDEDIDLAPDALEDTLQLFNGRTCNPFIVVNEDALPFNRQNLTCLAATHARIVRSGGLDESPYRAAGLSGPYELALRMQSDHPEIQMNDKIGGARGNSTQPDIEPLLRDLWPYAFSATRRLPRNENPAIRALREAL